MRARAAILVESSRPLLVDEVELPDPGPGQVLVRVLASGICHSQIHSIRRPEAPGAPHLPCLLGHESIGIVAAIGRNVANVKEGDHVLTTWVDRNNAEGALPPINHALNERPQPKARWKNKEVFASATTWADHLIASERVVVRLANVDPVDVLSVVGCAVMTGAGAVVNALRVRSGESVAVYGAGGVGLCALNAATIVDAYPIIAIDVSEEKLAFARKFGASHTINASNVDPIDAIRKIVAGGVDYAIDAIGVATTQQQIIESVRGGFPGMRRGGTALILGLAPPGVPISVNPNLLVGGRSLTHCIGGDCCPERDFPEFLRWYQEGKLKLDELVTRRYTLDQINEAVDDLAHGRISGRSILTFD